MKYPQLAATLSLAGVACWLAAHPLTARAEEPITITADGQAWATAYKPSTSTSWDALATNVYTEAKKAAAAPRWDDLGPSTAVKPVTWTPADPATSPAAAWPGYDSHPVAPTYPAGTARTYKPSTTERSTSSSAGASATTEHSTGTTTSTSNTTTIYPSAAKTRSSTSSTSSSSPTTSTSKPSTSMDAAAIEAYKAAHNYKPSTSPSTSPTTSTSKPKTTMDAAAIEAYKAAHSYKPSTSPSTSPATSTSKPKTSMDAAAIEAYKAAHGYPTK